MLRKLGLFGVLALLAAPAHAREPAFSVSDVGFTTQLHGVVDDGDGPWITVAEGKTTHDESPLAIVIREHRGKAGVTAKQLDKLAKLRADEDDAKVLRAVAGVVGARPSLEQWSVVDPKLGDVRARLYVTLPTKIVEIEVATRLKRDAELAADVTARVHRVLHGLRIKRLGDAALSPSKDALPAKTLLASLRR